MRMAVIVVTVHIVLLSIMLLILPGIIKNVRNDGGNIIVIGDGGGIICWSSNVIITIKLIMFNNLGVRIKLILVRDFVGDGGEDILI